jgi:hypothetical protein
MERTDAPPPRPLRDLRVELAEHDRVRVRHDGLWWRATVLGTARRHATVRIDGFERPVRVPASLIERGRFARRANANGGNTREIGPATAGLLIDRGRQQREPEGRRLTFRRVPFWPAVHQLGAVPALRSGPAVAALALTLLLLAGYLVGARGVERRRPEDALHAASARARSAAR